MLSATSRRLPDDELIGALGIDASASAAVAVLPRLMRYSDLLEGHVRPTPDRGYARYLLHADPAGRFSIWAIDWAPGAQSAVHDHSCWCTFGLCRGQLVEEHFLFDCGLRRTAGTVRGPGDIGALPAGPDGIHRIRNTGSAPAVSIHVYGFDPAVCASSLGRTYAG